MITDNDILASNERLIKIAEGALKINDDLLKMCAKLNEENQELKTKLNQE